MAKQFSLYLLLTALMLWAAPGEARQYPVTLQVSASQEFYTVGDPVKLEVQSELSGDLYVFSENSKGVTRLIYPNSYQVEGRRSSRPLIIPKGRYQLVAEGEGWEKILVVRTTKELPDGILPRHDQDFPVIRKNLEKLERVLISHLKKRDRTFALAKTEFHVAPKHWDRHVSRPLKGNISITSMPNNLPVKINNRYVGRTPLRKTLPVGTYRVDVHDDFYGTWTRRIVVKENRTAHVYAELPWIWGPSW